MKSLHRNNYSLFENEFYIIRITGRHLFAQTVQAELIKPCILFRQTCPGRELK